MARNDSAGNRRGIGRRKPIAILGLSCESVELWLADHRRHDAMPDAVSRHLEQCPHCALERREALPLREWMTGDPRSNRPERFSGRRLDGRDADLLFVRAVMSRVREELPPSRRRQARRRQWGVGGAAAAAVLLSLGLGLLLIGDGLGLGAPGAEAPAGVAQMTQIGANTTPPLAVERYEGNVQPIGFHPVFIPDEALQVVKF